MSTFRSLLFPVLLMTMLVALLWFATSRFVNVEAIKQFDFGVIWEYKFTLLHAAYISILITAFAIAVGLVLGTIIALIIIKGNQYVSLIASAYVELLRNTPLVVQLFWIHFALPLASGISTTATQSGILAITLQSSAYLADVARTGIRAVPKGQYEAADALGLSVWSKWMDVILPQALRIILPPLVSVTTDFLKATAILSLLSVGELMTQARNISYYTHKPIEIMTAAAIIYWVLGYCVGITAQYFGDKFSRQPAGNRHG